MVTRKTTDGATVDSPIVQIVQLNRTTMTLCVKGTQPLIFNRMAAKAQRALLIGQGRKTAAEKAISEKHNPVMEYVDSAYRYPHDERPTRLYMPASAFKGVLCTAALDMPGAKKAQVGRLVWVEDRFVDIYGTPQLSMMVVRSADMNRTPDIRTRAVLPAWACRVTVSFAAPLIKDTIIANLLGAGGITCGVGDYRQEKGKGSFGQFLVTQADDAEYMQICADGGREAQDEGLEVPKCFDPETQELFSWYLDEMSARKSTKRTQLKEVA